MVTYNKFHWDKKHKQSDNQTRYKQADYLNHIIWGETEASATKGH